jgi:hypothetical protein
MKLGPPPAPPSKQRKSGHQKLASPSAAFIAYLNTVPARHRRASNLARQNASLANILDALLCAAARHLPGCTGATAARPIPSRLLAAGTRPAQPRNAATIHSVVRLTWGVLRTALQQNALHCVAGVVAFPEGTAAELENNAMCIYLLLHIATRHSIKMLLAHGVKWCRQ